MKRYAAALSLCGVLAAVGLNAAFKSQAVVELAQLNANNWDDFSPSGKEVDAIYGDFVLRNEHLVAVIAQPIEGRNANMTVRNVGGCLVDLTRRNHQSDQLSAFYPAAKLSTYRSGESLDDQGKPIALSSTYSSAKAASIRVLAKSSETRPAVETTYSLQSDAEYLVVTTTYRNESAERINVQLEDALRADAQKEQIVKAPDGTADLYWFHDEFWGQAYGFDAPGLTVAANNSGAKDTTLRYEVENGRRQVEIEPGKSFSLTRRVYPGNDLPHVRAIAAKARQTPVFETVLSLRDAQDQPVPQAKLILQRGDSKWGSVLTDRKGDARTWLPAGDYQLTANVFEVAVVSDQASIALNVAARTEPTTKTIKLPAWRPGTVTAKVTDGAGQPIPCKIEFLAKAGTSQPSFGPESADFATKSLCFAPLGELQQALPPGNYEVVISHGPEFDAIFKDITVGPNQTVALNEKLPRVVNTNGWISSDFHSHSSPSGDNTGSQLGRVLNLLCDHIEFAPCTEHNRIDTYVPHIERLKVGRFMGTCTGMELTGTPLPLNHQNAFPMVMKPHLQDGGGPVTDSDIETQMERLALWDNRSEKLVQINHPDLGWMFNDKDGDGQPDAGHSRLLGLFDVIEIHPVPDILTLDPFQTVSSNKSNNRIFNWLQFLNQGRRWVGVVNTDAHYNYHESGWVRNWIKSPTDDPAAVKPLDVVRASSAGALVMSNGPFLDVRMSEAGRANWVIAGQDLTAPSKKVSVEVKVQCPNWLEIDRVFVLVNGRIHPQHHYRKATHSNLFRSGVVRFSEKLELELERDAHLIVVAGSELTTLGKVHGPTWGKHRPAAFINPIYVDVDGNGFQHNNDTLGRPLPVKFIPPKPKT